MGGAESVGENRSPPLSSSKLPLANRSCDSLETALVFGFLLLVSDFSADLEE